MKLRTATAADIPALVAISVECGTAAQWSEAAYRRMLSANSDYEVIVAAEQEVVGFAVAHVIGPEWELENVAVAAPAQRRGIGSALVNDIIRRAAARGANVVYLEVRESNAAARQLYLRCGFRETGRRPRYYSQPPEDAVLYEKRLVPE